MAGSTSAEPPTKIATRRRNNIPTPPSTASTDASTAVSPDRGFMLARPLLNGAKDQATDKASEGTLWPQCVAHRGYNRIWAENSIEALRSALSDDEVRAYGQKASSAGSRAADAEVSGSAVEALARADDDDSGDADQQSDGAKGIARARAADGIEFDVHLTRDKVVVVSHDASLKRCFGVDALIDARDWRGAEGIENMKSVREPHTRMPLFADVLRLLAGLHDRGERKWCMVDVKIDNPVDLMRYLGAELRAAAPKGELAYWNDKLALGLWHHKFVAPAAEHMPGVPISHIGVDLGYARRHWLDDDRVAGFNMQIYSLLSPWSSNGIGAGDRFVKDCHARGKAVSVWTVNSAPLVRYAQSLGCDVVMTDDPLLMESARQAAASEVEKNPSGGELDWDRAKFFNKLKTKITVAGFQWLLWSIFVYRVYWKYS